MTEKNYSVVFRGDIVMGKNLLEVKQKLKQIFKVDEDRINSLFVGKPVPLKTNLSQVEAEKYQAILRQAGIVVAIESAATAKKDKPAPSKKMLESNASTTEGEKKSSVLDEEWKLAPVGSLLQDKKVQQEKTIAVDVEHLSVLPQGGNLLKDNERQAEPLPIVDVDVLDWELTPYGEALLKETEKKKITPANIDIDSLSLTENEGNLLKESERVKVDVTDIDTSYLQLVPDENLSSDI